MQSDLRMIISIIFIIFYLFSMSACCPDKLVCTKSFNPLNRTFEITSCFFTTNSLNLIYQCELLNNLKASNNKPFEGIRSTLKFFKNQTITTNLIGSIHWNVSKNNKDNVYKSISWRSNQTFSNETDPTTELIIYNIEEGVLYQICTSPSILNNEKICCEILKNNTHEEKTHYMTLIIFIILIMIYLLVVVVHLTCPPSSFRSLDEMLEKLPSYHVSALKELINDREIIDEEETNKVSQNPEVKYVRHRYVKKKMLFPDRLVLNKSVLTNEDMEDSESLFDNQDACYDQINLGFQKPKRSIASVILLTPHEDKSNNISIMQVYDDQLQSSIQEVITSLMMEKDRAVLAKSLSHT